MALSFCFSSKIAHGLKNLHPLYSDLREQGKEMQGCGLRIVIWEKSYNFLEQLLNGNNIVGKVISSRFSQGSGKLLELFCQLNSTEDA